METLTFADETATHGPAVAAPGLILMMDCKRPLTAPRYIDLSDLTGVLIGRGEQTSHNYHNRDGGRHLHIQLADRWLSTRHVQLVRMRDSWQLIDPGSKNGTLVNRQKVTEATLRDRDVLEVGHTIFLYRFLYRPEDAPSGSPIADRDPSLPDALFTLNPKLAAAFRNLPRVAASSLPIVITGETGTGKEVLARAIHEMSGRTGRFVGLNCGALPSTIIESELFGAEKGAFSGAVKSRTGLVRAAHEGTLFLDEIAELPAASQAVLLRVLQEGEVLPVGATTPIKVDIRVLAATHQDLRARVESGAFRRDLFARLCGFVVTLPPLRERREDIGRLVANLLVRIAGERASSLRFSRKAARKLFMYDWPMNVRELEQVLHAATLMAESGKIDVTHLPDAIARPARPSPAQPPNGVPGQAPDQAPGPSASQAPPSDSENRPPEPDPPARQQRVSPIRATDADAEERLIGLARAHDGNIAAMARALGTSRSQVRRLLKRFAIDVRDHIDLS